MCWRISYLLFFNCVILLLTHGDSRDILVLPPKIGAVLVWTDPKMYEVDVQTIYYDSTVNKGFYVNHNAAETDLLIFDYTYNITRIINLKRKTCRQLRITDSKTLIDPKYFFTTMTSNAEFVNTTKIYEIIDGFTYNSSSKTDKVLTSFAHPNWTFPHSFNGDWSRPLTSEFTRSINQNLLTDSFYFMDVTDTIPAHIFVPPPMVNCPIFNDDKRKVPALMDEFQVEIEDYDANKQKSEVKMYVNAKVQVARQDTRVVNADGNVDYVTFITDYTFGIMYTLDKANGKCLSKDALSVDYSQLTLVSASFALFLQHDLTSLQYVGDRDCSYGDCEVWASTYDGVYHEIYWKRSTQTVDGVTQNVDIPIRMDLSSPTQDLNENKFNGQAFYFNYEPKYPEWSVFDITDCYNDTYMLRFQVQFLGDYFAAGSIFNFEKAFLKRIADLTYLPAIRIHKIRVDTLMNAYVVVTVTLLEDPQNTGLVGAFAHWMKYHDTNDVIYRKVSDAVTGRKFGVIVKDANGTDVIFTAQFITKDILSDEKIDQLSSSLVKFTREDRKSIAPLSSDLTIEGTTVDECARQCEREESSTCDKFTYCRSTSSCVLTQNNDNQEPIINSDCDLYTRQYAYDYKLFEGFRLASGPGDYAAETEDLRVCFRDCFRRQNDTYACHSIDFCSDGAKHSCSYHAKHFVQTSINEIVPDKNCLHYSQNFIQMYHIFPGMQWKNDAVNYGVIKRDISAWECAQSCTLDPSGCTDFEMCQQMIGFGRKTECRLYEPYDSSKDPPTYVVASDCDHYRLKGIKTQFNFDNLGMTDAPPPPPTNAALKASAGDYGAGDMAGLGIAMLLIGGIGGFGLIYLYTRYEATKGNDQNILLQLVRN